MNYSDRVRSVRAAITTVEARKERQGAVCLILHGPSGSWTVNDGWKGGDGVSYPQWFGQGVRWYKDEPADILRNDLNTLQLTLLDLVGGNISIGFDNADDVDDTWGFEFSLTAITDGGDVSLVDPLGQPTVLAPPRRVGNVSSKSFYFKIPPPPPPPSPPDTWQLVQSLIQQGKCDQAEGVANKPFQLAEVAFCFATHDEHLNAARVAGIAEQQLGTQSALSAGYKLMMRDLRTEQIAIDKVKQRQWQTARFVVDHPAPFRTALELIVDELYATWEKAIATFKDKDPFGPFKLVRREPSIEYTYTPFTIGTVTLIKNQTVVSIKSLSQ